MKFNPKELAQRLTGISTPMFGLSWNPPEPDILIARRVITFLEDKRVLYVPSEVEIPQHYVDSVLAIREYLTEELMKLPSDKEIAQSLRAMRAACRKFLDRVGADEKIIRFGGQRNHWANWVFVDALGQMRGVFGVHILKLAASYGLDVGDDLAAILPVQDDDP